MQVTHTVVTWWLPQFLRRVDVSYFIYVHLRMFHQHYLNIGLLSTREKLKQQGASHYNGTYQLIFLCNALKLTLTLNKYVALN